MPSAVPGSGSPKTMMPPAMQRDVRRGAGDGDDRDGLAVLQAAGRGVEGGDRGDDRDERPRADSEPEQPVRADEAGERLDRDVGDAEEDAGGGAEHDAVVLDAGADARAR